MWLTRPMPSSSPSSAAAWPVRLRLLRVEDADRMATVLADPRLYEYTGGEPPTAEELTRRYAAQTRGGPADGSEIWLNFIVELADDGVPVGYVQATLPVARTGTGAGTEAEIAWVIGAPWQGRGLASAAAALLVEELRSRSVERLVADIRPGHLASQRIAEKLGLERTGEFVDGEERWAGPLDG